MLAMHIFPGSVLTEEGLAQREGWRNLGHEKRSWNHLLMDYRVEKSEFSIHPALNKSLD